MSETGFACSSNDDAKILILGSMPSRKSLAAEQYYAHPQNSFWPMMGELFDFDPNRDYSERLLQLRKNGIALWDVAFHCVRPGSMDHAIDIQSVVTNDFSTFFQRYPHIRVIFFNGRKAEELYNKLVLARLPMQFQQIKRHLLPSSSPANAGMSRVQKFEIWKIVKDTLEID